MSRTLRTAVRSAVVAAGAAVIVASVLRFQLADWPIYVTYFALLMVLFSPTVEVLPRLALGVPEMATTLGFLYIGGLPIIVLRILVPIVIRATLAIMPERWKQGLPHPRNDVGPARRDLFSSTWGTGARIGTIAEWATDALGLGVRWWIASALVPDSPPVTEAAAIAAAELGGYVCWGLLSILPIYPDRTLLPLSVKGGLREALADIFLIVVLALTPFVFLIAYGFRAHGLEGAAAWSLSALGLHFMLKQLSQRRRTVEAQNQRLENLNRELEHRERLSAIGKMSSVVSHQILHQLGVIGIYADLIRNTEDQGDPAATLVHIRRHGTAIEEALRDVNRVLTDLLVFSRDLRLNLYDHPLTRVIEESIEECGAEAAERGVLLRFECPGDITVTLDKLKMKQALANILRNAIEVSPPGAEISVRGSHQDGCAEIRISDRGPGVPERDRDAVFTPFFTTKEHGSGLGLSIALEFTNAHGGRLWVEGHGSDPGATFVFQLPLRR